LAPARSNAPGEAGPPGASAAVLGPGRRPARPAACRAPWRTVRAARRGALADHADGQQGERQGM